MIRSLKTVGVLAVLVALVPLYACEDSTPSPEEREAVLKVIRGYLAALSDAYSELDPTHLEGWASPNEIAAVRKLVTGLVRTGDRVDSTMRVFEVEHLEIFRQINATARLVEVWDVVRYDATSGVEKGRTPDSIQYTLLQLRKVEGEWLVIGRSVLQRETPIADETEEVSG